MDLRKLKKLIDLVQESGIAELEVTEGEEKVRISRAFIDREAKFAWIARPSECPKKAVGFDYDGADFTHVKNRVTFEVLATAFGLDRDPALAKIGAAVHFLDVGGIPVPDATGLETMLKGARERARSDDALLGEAVRVLDLLYSAYRPGSA